MKNQYNLVGTYKVGNISAFLWQLRNEGYLYEVEVLDKSTGECLHKEVVEESYEEAEMLLKGIAGVKAQGEVI